MLKYNTQYFTVYQTGYSSDISHSISLNTCKNINTAHDVKSDVNEPNDIRNITCPLNVVQHIFY